MRVLHAAYCWRCLCRGRHVCCCDAGSGATGAIAKLVHILGLRSRAAHPTAAVHRCSFPGCGRSFADAGDLKLHQQTHRDGHFESGKTSAPGGESSTSVGPAGVGVGAGTGAGAGAGTNAGTGPSGTPSAVVFVGPYAHHSNILPWSESGAHVVPIPEARGGGVDMDALQAALDQYSDPSIFKVGAFTLASNVTGCVCDDDAVTRLLHAKGALAVWDCAASAPHVPINMNPMDTETMARRPDGTSALAKDAVFFSPHKFCGGPCTPGVLVVKRSLMTNAVPSTPGGGTVFFVHKDGTPRYLQNEAEREEGGTPNIVGAVRCVCVNWCVFACLRRGGLTYVWRRLCVSCICCPPALGLSCTCSALSATTASWSWKTAWLTKHAGGGLPTPTLSLPAAPPSSASPLCRSWCGTVTGCCTGR